MTTEELLATMKADAATKEATIKSLTEELSKKDELIKKADDDKKKRDDDDAKAKKDAEEATKKAEDDKKKADDDKKKDDDDRKKKDEDYAKLQEDLKKKDAEIEELKKPKAAAGNPLSGLKEKIDSMVTRLGDAADPAIKGIQEEVNKLIGHEAEEGKLHEELLGDDDDEKETMVNAVSELADSAHADITVNRPVPKKESKYEYLRRVLSVNKSLISPEYQFLASKVDKDTFGVAKLAFADMGKNVRAKTAELQGKAGSGAKVAIRQADGSILHPNWGKKADVI